MFFTLLQYLPFFYQAAKLQAVIATAMSLLPTSVISALAAARGVIAVSVAGREYKWTSDCSGWC